jgi:hypothetical protein
VLLAQMNDRGLDTINVNLAKQFLQNKMEESRQKVSKTGLYRDYSSTFKNLKDLNLPSQFEFLRKKDDYAKKGLFSNKLLEDGMMLFSEEPIPKSLVDYTMDSRISKQKAKELHDMALQINKDLLHYMKIRYHQFPAALSVNIIKLAVNNSLLRDEVCLQVIKQTKNNPNVLSAALALKLLYLCLLCFRPSSKMEDILKSHLAGLASPQVGKLTTYDIMEDLAARCFELLSHPLPQVPHPPTQDEAVTFYDLTSERLTFTIENQGQRKMVDKKSSEFHVRIPLTPSSLDDVLPVKEGQILAHDLATHISSQLRLPFIGRIKLVDAPAELKLDNDGVLGEQDRVVEIIESIKSAKSARKAQWLLIPGQEKLEEEEKDDEFDDEKEAELEHEDLDDDDEAPPPPPPEEDQSSAVTFANTPNLLQEKKKADPVEKPTTVKVKEPIKRKTAAEKLEELKEKEQKKKVESKSRSEQANLLKERARALREKKTSESRESMGDIPIPDETPSADGTMKSSSSRSLKSTIKKGVGSSTRSSGDGSSRSRSPMLKSTVKKKSGAPSASALFENPDDAEEQPQ